LSRTNENANSNIEFVAKPSMGENHIILILAVFVLFMAFVRICFDELLEKTTTTTAGCLSGSVLYGDIIFWLGEHCLEFFVFVGIALGSKKQIVPQEFSISRETTVLSACWFLITGCAAMVFILKGWHPKDTLSEDWHQRWNTICDMCYLFVAATIGSTYPLIKSYASSGVNWFPLYGGYRVLQSLESIFNNKKVFEEFQIFLIEECTYENLWLWTAIELFKDSKNLCHAQRIFNTFLKEGSEREVTIVCAEFRSRMCKNLSCPHELADYSCMFDEVQKEIFEYMRRESYPRFLKSCRGKKLMENLDQEELLRVSLTECGML